MNKVLVINIDETPVGVISWTKAITMFVLGKVEIYKHNQQQIRSEKLNIPMPIIVKLKKYKYIKYLPKLNKYNIFLRDHYICQYCEKKLTDKTATMDHIIPKVRGGKNAWENIVTCCKPCNLQKADKLIKDTNMSLISNPVKLFGPKFNMTKWAEYLEKE